MTTKATLLVALGLSILLFPTGASPGSDSCGSLEPAVLIASQGDPGSPVEDEASERGLIGVNTRMTPQPDLPFEITRVAHDADIVTRESYLQYTVTNRGAYPLTQLDLLILVFDADHRTRGGQRVREAFILPPGQTTKRNLRLSNLLYRDPFSEYAEIALAVTDAQTGPIAWSRALQPAEFTMALRDRDPIPMTQSHVTTASECPAFCIQCREWARADCTCGVLSFSCSLSTCTCTFTCRTGCPLP